MGYFPICIYCDWRELRGEAGREHVRLLNQMRFICFTSILFPTTTFADTLFWRIWNKDRELVAPSSVDSLVPFWTQHSMHTVSLVAVLLDLVLVPRKRPESLLRGSVPMFLFIGCYTIVCGFCILKGEYLYPVLKTLNHVYMRVSIDYGGRSPPHSVRMLVCKLSSIEKSENTSASGVTWQFSIMATSM
ncbi:androgen-dependent TFPI-regulating protein [Aphomia sociella]